MLNNLVSIIVNIKKIITYCLFPTLILVYFFHLFVVGHNFDHIAILYYARKILDGQVFYRDIIEINPPLIFYIYSIPSYLSKILNVPTQYTLDIFGLICTAIGLTCCNSILKNSDKFAEKGDRVVIILVIATGLMFLPFIQLNHYLIDCFVDRASLLAILSMPYFLLSMPSFRSTNLSFKLRFLVSVMAGVGFCIKPQYGLMWLIPNIVISVQEKSIKKAFLRIENIIICSIAVTYISLVVLLYQEYLQVVMPMLIETYGVVQRPFISKLFNTLFPGVFVYFLLVNYLSISSKLKDKFSMRADVIYLLCLVLGGLILLFVAGGWVYTYYLSRLFAFFLVIVIIYEYICVLKKESDNKLRASSQTGLLLGIVFLLFLSFSSLSAMLVIGSKESGNTPYMNDKEYKYYFDLMDYVDNNTEKGTFHTLSLGFVFWDSILATPEHNSKIISVQRFQQYFMIPGLYEVSLYEEERAVDLTQDVRSEKKWVWQLVTDIVAEDFKTKKPELAIVSNDVKDYKTLEFFLSNKTFKEQWNSYSFIETFKSCRNEEEKKNDKCMKFDMYKRNYGDF